MKTATIFVICIARLIEFYEGEFSERGYVIQSATKTKQGLSSILWQPPDLVIIHDYVLIDELDALALCQKIRAHLKHLPVVLISDEGNRSAVQRINVDFIETMDFLKELFQYVEKRLPIR
ncbi:hypothetical protein HC928_08375 [bacterium]|nr:hypothetical protein [bacterium]